MVEDLIVLGAGGLAHECWEVLKLGEGSAFRSIQCFADPQPSASGWTAGVFERTGSLTDFRAIPSLEGHAVLVAIGDVAARSALIQESLARGGQLLTLRHPSAIIGHSCHVGAGTIVLPLTVLTANVHIGEGVVINPSVSISHDVSLGSFCNIGPGARICGRVTVGDYVSVGAGAVILPDVLLGDGAEVGAGAVVTTSVPARTTVKGIPARP